MEREIVECLSCGQQRTLVKPDGRTVTAGECPRCGYVGWAPRTDMSERARQVLRDVPVVFRRASSNAA